MESNGKAWTVKERQEAERLRLEGLEIAEIGRRLGRTRVAVRGQLFLLGVKKPSRLLFWAKHLRQDERIVDAAKRLGVSPGCIEQAKRRLRKLGVDI